MDMISYCWALIICLGLPLTFCTEDSSSPTSKRKTADVQQNQAVTVANADHRNVEEMPSLQPQYSKEENMGFINGEPSSHYSLLRKKNVGKGVIRKTLFSDMYSVQWIIHIMLLVLIITLFCPPGQLDLYSRIIAIENGNRNMLAEIRAEELR